MPRQLAVAVGYGDQPNGNFIPEIWTMKLQKKYYAYTQLSVICNNDWEGEIKGAGSTVNIRVIPTVTINTYTVGTKINYQDLDDSKIQLLIDKAEYFAFAIDDVDKAQNDINMMNVATGSAAEQMKITIEQQVYSTIYSDATTDLGAYTITRANVLGALVDIEVALDNQSVPAQGRYVLLPPWACGVIKRSDLQDASLSGDDKSLLRQKANQGYSGSISGLAIYKTNNLTGGNIIAGTKDFVCFASQFTKTETGRRQDTFGDYVRGLQVYGYKATKPEAGVTAQWTQG